ncbi:YdeI/OmpD-associated family protein [Methylobacterium iners]|uniref:YdeI/OmpD-associated family protein n=1 Tax=Methylobacterium iners TaxID=418707 RepID=UPI001EE2AB0E|nr:YdeI/OmpD-associated family protein [Methylobacterium iners]
MAGLADVRPFTHSFEATIERHGVGRDRKVWYAVLFLPDVIAKEMPFDRYPQLRVEGEIAELPVKNAFIPAGDGRYYVIVSADTLKNAGVALGHTVEMRFRVADQDAVDVPDSLARALSSDETAARAWDALTVGQRRGLPHHVASARTKGTSDRRVAAVLAALTGNLPSDVLPADVKRLHRLLGRPGLSPEGLV